MASGKRERQEVLPANAGLLDDILAKANESTLIPDAPMAEPEMSADELERLATANRLAAIEAEVGITPAFVPLPQKHCEICNSSFSEDEGCANAECSLNLAKIEADAKATERARRMVDIVAETKVCQLCNEKRPCCPDHYAAMGYELSDEEFLKRFGAPLVLPRKLPHGAPQKCEVIENIHVNGQLHGPGEFLVVSRRDIDGAPHCFKVL